MSASDISLVIMVACTLGTIGATAVAAVVYWRIERIRRESIADLKRLRKAEAACDDPDCPIHATASDGARTEKR